jgi:hypothetical protein
VKWEFDSIGIMQTMPMIESDMTDYFTTEKRTTNEKKAYGKIIFSIDSWPNHSYKFQMITLWGN